MTKDEMISYTQKLEALKKITQIEQDRRDKKKLIDEMERYLGFYVLDYVKKMNKAGNIQEYDLSDDISGMVSNFLFFKEPTEDIKEQLIDSYISKLSLSQKISEAEGIAKTIKRKINKKGNPKNPDEKQMKEILNEREYKLWKFLKAKRIIFERHEKLEIPENVLEEYINHNENEINVFIKEEKKKTEYKNIISKMKKAKKLNEIEIAVLKHTLKNRISNFLTDSEETEMSKDEMEAIVDNQMLKMEKYQEAVRNCNAASTEIKKEFERKIISSLKMKKYYDSSVSTEEAKKKTTGKLHKIEQLKEQLLQMIRDFDADDE